MPSRWSRSLADLFARTRRPAAPRRARPRVEGLEDRITPAVTAMQDAGGVVTVTLATTGAAGDAATIRGTTTAGTDIEVVDTLNATTTPFNGVTGIVVMDAGANAGQTVTFTDIAGGTKIQITGAVTADAIETVIFLGGAPLQAGSVAVTTATAGVTIAGDVTTTAAAGQSYGGPVTVGSGIVNAVTLATGAGPVAFTGTVDSPNAGTPVSLTVNAGGATTFTGAVGASFSLLALTTDAAGTTSLGGNVTTLGGQAFADPVTIAAATATVASTGSGAITFAAVDGQAAGTNSLFVNTTGTTTFGGDIGAAFPLLNLTTNALGTTNFVNALGLSRTVATTGAQAFNDSVVLNVQTGGTVTFAGASVAFNGTVNGTTTGTNGVAVNAAGTTTFGGRVGGVFALASVATDAAGTTVIADNVTTQNAQTYADPVTIAPGTGVTAVTLASNVTDLTLGGTLGGASALPVTLRAAGNLSVGGNVTFPTAGSQFTAQAASAGTGTITVAAGVTVRADTQTWRTGDGSGGVATAVSDLVTTAPAFRAAVGGNTAPRVFVLRQDGAVTDATIPPPVQFGGLTPAIYTILSDDGTVTLATSTLAGPGTTSLTVAAGGALVLGAAVNAPTGTVRLRSANAGVTQTGGGVTAANLGVRAATGIVLDPGGGAGNAVGGTFAAQTATGAVRFVSAAAVTVGTVGTDPLNLTFPLTTGVTTTGTVDFAAAAGTGLNLTIAAPVSGSTVTATAGPLDGRVTVNYTLATTAALPNGLTFTGGAGTDTLAVTDAGGTANHTYVVNATLVRDGAAQPLTYTGVENVTVTGGSGNDTFAVTPNAVAAITVTGGLPNIPPAAGDQLTVNLAGTTTPVLTNTMTADGFGGTATFGNARPVAFAQMESVNPQADIRVTATGPAFISAGTTGTVTVVVSNAGAIAAPGVSVSNVVPAGLSATWTATASSGSSAAATTGSGDINTTVALAAGGSVTFTVTLTPSPGASGSFTTAATVGTTAGAFDPNFTNNRAAATFGVGAVGLTAAGAGAGGGPQVKVYNADGTLRFNLFAFDPAYLGGVTVATGDLTGDGVEDIVAGAAVGSSHVKVFDGKTGGEIASFFAFPGFAGGVNVTVAAGQVVVGAGPGGGPIVSAFGLTGGLHQTFTFFAFDPAFRGGVQVGGAAGLLAVGAGPGGGPHVKLFTLPDLAQVASFFAFPEGSPDGVSVAVGAVNGRTAVIVGAGPGGSPTALAFDAATATRVSSTSVYDANFAGGVRVAAATTAVGREATAFGTGPGGAPRVRVLAPDGTSLLDFFAFDPAFKGGVYVG